MKLARPTPPATTMSERQIVEYQQLPRLKNNVDLYRRDVQAVPLEEDILCTQVGELRPTEKLPVGLYAYE
jgi:hypothetical protein